MKLEFVVGSGEYLTVFQNRKKYSLGKFCRFDQPGPNSEFVVGFGEQLLKCKAIYYM